MSEKKADGGGCLILIVAFVALAWAFGTCRQELPEPKKVQIRLEGRRAREISLPPTVNPYQGQLGANEWLNGYVEAVEEKK